ncbi:putative ATP-binding cassette transporter [Seiridium cardinale]|uniref:ATP-binding cassette transporter n=1 Tax=Seiridium cardinale TaxID=138064 RepID=A0ABR2XU91_9PEZI
MSFPDVVVVLMKFNIASRDTDLVGMTSALQSTHSELCAIGSDNRIGPRVDVACRAFDFTLLFEDTFFTALPAAVFLILLPFRLRTLHRSPKEASSYTRAIWKSILYLVLLVFNVLLLAFRQQEPFLRTPMSIASATLTSIAVAAAGVLSYFEDQRSIRPSDLLVLYFSASDILLLPTLRSFWLVPCSTTLRSLAIVTLLMTTVVVFVESARKLGLLRPVEKGESKEQLVGLWSRGFFTWALPFLRKGYSSVLILGQIPRVDHELREDSTWTKLHDYWHSVKRGRYRLLRATFWSHSRLLVSAVLPRLALSAFVFCQPFLIDASVSYLTAGAQDNVDEQFGPALIGAFVLVYLGIAVSRAFYWRQTNRTIASIRSCLIAMIYRHTTGLKATELKDTAIVTLMGTDVERIAQALRLIHELWASILEVGIALWLLQRQMSWAFLVPLIITLASVLMTWGVSNRIGSAQAAWSERVQKRVAVTSGMLSNMKAVQMLGMTGFLRNAITKLRELELRTSERFRMLLIWQILLGNAPVTLAPFITFVVYIIIAVVSKSETLLSAQAFASLSLISLATAPLIRFCQALPSLAQAAACFGRIETFCLKESTFEETNLSVSPAGSSKDTLVLREMRYRQPEKGGPLMIFEHAHIAWDSNSSPVLQDLTLELPSGLTAIVGPVASGKSTLLWTILGETKLNAGSMTSAVTRAAFCSQTPWIMDDTIRHNITLGMEFDQEWYNFSLDYSCLQGDLDALPRRDFTAAGSNGVSLSGGQRQRLALARAIYSRLPIVLLDDVMSGLDAKTANILSARLFRNDGYFRRAGISVVLATNDQKILRYMDIVLVLEGGKLIHSGPFHELQHWSAGFSERNSSSETITEVAGTHSSDNDTSTHSQAPHQATDSPGEDSMELDERQTGNWSVYVYYCRSAGALSMILWGVSLLLGAVCSGVSTIWVDKWTEANQVQSNQRLGYYLGVYAVFVVLANIGMAGELWAPISFFQQEDVGSILNRFSQDMDMIDMVLPTQAAQFTTGRYPRQLFHVLLQIRVSDVTEHAGAAYCVVQLVIICVLGKYLTATVPVCVGVLFLLQRYYLRTSRQVRLIDIEAKAPLYKHFVETLSGVTTIRAFGRSPAFHQQHQQILDLAQAPYYMLFCIQQWLVLVLDLMVGGLAVVIAAIALSPSRSSSNTSISAGDLGVALVIILQFNNLLSQSIQAWTKLETSIGAVSRVQKFVKETPQEPVGNHKPLPDWPALGSIRFENVTASYATGGHPVLTDLSLEINPGEKVAICGPSGSGKSTILMALLRMIEVQGRITIDDIDISRLSGDDFRSRLNVLPQEAFFLPGTVRSNLDVRGPSSSDVIQKALEGVGLWDRVFGIGGLDADLDPTEWSQGEKQLLCLARAWLTPSKVLVVDEATSSVDNKTESIMLDVIGNTFKEHTVISVVHRFAKIEQYDRVAVLKQGKIIEYDTPQVLLDRESAFRELYTAYMSER